MQSRQANLRQLGGRGRKQSAVRTATVKARIGPIGTV
jgi:hypothetical protein